MGGASWSRSPTSNASSNLGRVALPSAGSAVPADRERIVVTATARETRRLAATLANAARPGDVIALFGELGAGKTEFAKGFAEGLGVPVVVNSPSFVLMAEYRGRLPLFHLDLFRLAGPDDVVGGGLADERRSGGVTLIEWAERMGPLLPRGHLGVLIEGSGDEPRRVALRASEDGYARYLAALAGPTR